MILTYKLYNADSKEIENFLKKNGLKYNIKVNGKDVKVDFFSNGFLDTQFDLINKSFITNFSNFIYSEEDITLEEQLVKILTIQQKLVSVAESFTGGGIAKRITSVSGASKVLYEGIVSYSTESKIERLKVKEETLSKFNAVSGQVAYEMACGLLKQKNVDIVIATTGIAGPNSDDSNYPVGLCYVAVGSEKRVTAHKFNFKGSRQEIVEQGIENALFLAIKLLRNPLFNIV